MKNKRFMKTVMTAILSMVLIFCLSFSALAVTPRWVSLKTIEIDMTFDSGDGNVTATATKKSTATSIEGTLYLYKLVGSSWVYVDDWSKSTTRTTLAISGDFTAASNTSYKAVFTVTAYTGNTPESHTIECIEVSPSN